VDADIGDNGLMSPRTTRTRRPRLVPAALLASGLVVATAATVLAAIDRPAPATAQSCADGREWVTVQPLSMTTTTNGWRAAEIAPAGASLAGCVDTGQLPDQTGQSDPRG
jgi:hypothetical protein